MGSVFCSSFTPFLTLSVSLPPCFFCSLALPRPIWEDSAETQEATWRKGPLKAPAWELCLAVKAGGMAVLLWQCTFSSAMKHEASWAGMYFPLCCEGKKHMRRKYSCSRALLPSVQRSTWGGRTGTERENQEESIGGLGRDEGKRGKLQMERRSSLCMHKCYLKICLARERANSLTLWDCISWVPVIVPPESAAFHSSSIMCVFLPHSPRLFSILWPQAEQDIALSICLSNV